MYLHQTPSLVEGTVEHNLGLPSTLRVRRAPFPREQAIALLAHFERPEAFLTRSQANLSGGERQMVGLVPCV